MLSTRVSPFRALVSFALMSVSVACVHQRPAADAATASSWSSTAVVPLEVKNHHWLDVTIYLERDGQRRRLGVATATTTAIFNFPATYLGPSAEFRLVADPIGEYGRVSTELLKVLPGQSVVWTLESQLSHSAIAIW